jgi:hypothetical protein
MKQFLKLLTKQTPGPDNPETADGIRQAQKKLSGLKPVWFASAMLQSVLQ